MLGAGSYAGPNFMINSAAKYTTSFTGLKEKCRAVYAALELETKAHPKFRDHGEGPY